MRGSIDSQTQEKINIRIINPFTRFRKDKGKVSEILRYLMKEGAKAREADRGRKIIEVMSYVRGSLDWIENILKVEGYESGPVEKTVDIAVSRRFKKRGMSWYKRNANLLLKLRLLKLNGQWDAYWEQRQRGWAKYAA